MEMNNKIKNLIPYYEEPNIKIYCGDCLEVMKEFPDKYFYISIEDKKNEVEYTSYHY